MSLLFCGITNRFYPVAGFPVKKGRGHGCYQRELMDHDNDPFPYDRFPGISIDKLLDVELELESRCDGR